MVSLWLQLSLLLLLPSIHSFNFYPESTEIIVDPALPALFNLSESQTTTDPVLGPGSYWTSSFLTGSDGHQYIVVSHTLSQGTVALGYYRASVLNLDNLESFTSYVQNANISLQQSNQFNISATGYGFEALTDDQLSKLRTWSNHDNVVFDITLESTSKVLYNGGAGQFTFGKGITSEWGLPMCRTTGSLTVNGKKITIDPEKSFTWYDRQWGEGRPTNGNWTWFELHFDESSTKASVWAIDNDEPYRRDRFATLRTEDGQYAVLTVGWTANTSKTYVSPKSGVEYPLQWTIDFGKGGYLVVDSIRPDQELVAAGSIYDTAYEGFVTISGHLESKKVTGFGVVEMVRTSL